MPTIPKVQDPSLNIVAHGNVMLKGVTDEHAPPHLALQDLHTLRFALKEEIHVLCDQLQNVAFPMSDSKNVFAYSFEGVYQEDGWKVYDAEKELQRMVRQRNSWRVVIPEENTVQCIYTQWLTLCI